MSTNKGATAESVRAPPSSCSWSQEMVQSSLPEVEQVFKYQTSRKKEIQAVKGTSQGQVLQRELKINMFFQIRAADYEL